MEHDHEASSSSGNFDDPSSLHHSARVVVDDISARRARLVAVGNSYANIRAQGIRSDDVTMVSVCDNALSNNSLSLNDNNSVPETSEAEHPFVAIHATNSVVSIGRIEMVQGDPVGLMRRLQEASDIIKAMQHSEPMSRYHDQEKSLDPTAVSETLESNDPVNPGMMAKKLEALAHLVGELHKMQIIIRMVGTLTPSPDYHNLVQNCSSMLADMLSATDQLLSSVVQPAQQLLAMAPVVHPSVLNTPKRLLKGCHVCGKDEMAIIIRAMEQVADVSALYFQDLNLTGEGIVVLMDYLVSSRRALAIREINLTGNPALFAHEQGCGVLIKLIQQCTNLKELDVSECDLSFACAQEIASCVANTGILSLNLGQSPNINAECEMGHALARQKYGVEILCDLLKKSTSPIMDFRLANVGMNKKGLQAFLSLVKHKHSIISVCVDDNVDGFDDIKRQIKLAAEDNYRTLLGENRQTKRVAQKKIGSFLSRQHIDDQRQGGHKAHFAEGGSNSMLNKFN